MIPNDSLMRRTDLSDGAVQAECAQAEQLMIKSINGGLVNESELALGLLFTNGTQVLLTARLIDHINTCWAEMNADVQAFGVPEKP